MSEVLYERLRALATMTKPSGMRRMADVLPEIERALASGVPRSAVVEALKGNGIEMTLATFSANLYRLRKAAPGMRSSQQATYPAAPASAAPPSSAVETPHRYGQHDPRRLDDILRSAPDMKALAKLAKKE